MKAVGMTRKVDGLGRVILPKELRNDLEIAAGELIELYVEENMLYVKRYYPECIFCESTEDVIEYNDKIICKKCIEELKAL
jgi:transcriptional pleiotropic regulator of transition state genes